MKDVKRMTMIFFRELIRNFTEETKIGRTIMALNVTKEQMNFVIEQAMKCKGQEDEVILQKLYNYVTASGQFEYIVPELAYVLVSLENFKRFLENEKKVLDKALEATK